MGNPQNECGVMAEKDHARRNSLWKSLDLGRSMSAFRNRNHSRVIWCAESEVGTGGRGRVVNVPQGLPTEGCEGRERALVFPL